MNSGDTALCLVPLTCQFSFQVRGTGAVIVYSMILTCIILEGIVAVISLRAELDD